MARLISPDEKQTVIKPNNGLKFTVEEVQALLRDSIEIVRYGNGDNVMITNMGFSEELKVNGYASKLLKRTVFGNVLACKHTEAP